VLDHTYASWSCANPAGRPVHGRGFTHESFGRAAIGFGGLADASGNWRASVRITSDNAGADAIFPRVHTPKCFAKGWLTVLRVVAYSDIHVDDRLHGLSVELPDLSSQQ
jgi:hypothetical protein